MWRGKPLLSEENSTARRRFEKLHLNKLQELKKKRINATVPASLFSIAVLYDTSKLPTVLWTCITQTVLNKSCTLNLVTMSAVVWLL